MVDTIKITECSTNSKNKRLKQDESDGDLEFSTTIGLGRIVKSLK
jgi:hypothetical protein